MSRFDRVPSDIRNSRQSVLGILGLAFESIVRNHLPFLILCAAFVLVEIESELRRAIQDTPVLWRHLDAAFRLLIMPWIRAGMLGAICCTVINGMPAPLSTVLRLALRNYPRFVFAGVFLFLLSIPAAVLLQKAIRMTGIWTHPQLPLILVGIPLSFARLCWLSALVPDRKRTFRSLGRGLLSAVRSPLGLFCVIAGSLLSALSTAGSIVFRMPLPVAAARSILECLADTSILAVLTVIYVETRVSVFHEAPLPSPDRLMPSQTREEVIGRAVKVLVLLSVLPVLNVVAAIAGWRHIRTASRFTVSGIAALCSGVLSVIAYSIVLLGLLLPRTVSPGRFDYDLILDADPSLASQVALLRSGRFEEAEKELLALARDRQSALSWPLWGALALAEANRGNDKKAYGSFSQALQQDGAPPALFIAYGRTMLRNKDYALASNQFSEALKRDPLSADARRMKELADNVFEPSKLVNGVWFFITLLFLFTFHEYAHAYTAWRLGDDTAMRAGRVTLNPIPHLDLFGSLLLPGILIFKGSDMVFGWAKPVPVNSARLQDPLRDHRSVSFAGPGMNLLMAAVAITLFLTVLFVVRALSPEAISMNVIMPGKPVSVGGIPGSGVLTLVFSFLKLFVYSSLTIALFNLIPFPPLDGSWILSSLLGPRAMAFHAGLQKLSFLFILILAFTPIIDYILIIPILPILGILQLAVRALGFA